MSELLRLARVVSEIVKGTPLSEEISSIISSLETKRLAKKSQRKCEIFRVEVRGEAVKYVHGVPTLAKMLRKKEHTIRCYLSSRGEQFTVRAPSLDEDTPYTLCMVTRLPREEVKI